MRWALPAQHKTLDAWVVRGLALLARQQVLKVGGLDHVRAAHDPFILAINHSTRTESLLVPALLILHRGDPGWHPISWSRRPHRRPRAHGGFDRRAPRPAAQQRPQACASRTARLARPGHERDRPPVGQDLDSRWRRAMSRGSRVQASRVIDEAGRRQVVEVLRATYQRENAG